MKKVLSAFVIIIGISIVMIFIGKDMSASNEKVVQVTFENRNISEESIDIHAQVQCVDDYEIKAMQVDEQPKVENVTELDFTATENRDYIVKVYYQSLTEQKELSQSFITTVDNIESYNHNISLLADDSDVVTVDGYTFDKSTGTIKSGPNKGDIVIPSQIDGVSVTSIGDSAYVDCKELTSVKLPESIKRIGGGAFYLCFGLTSVYLPEGLTIIEDEGFDGCIKLDNITLPSTLQSIGKLAFFGCAMEEIIVPESVTYLGDWVFNDCRNLKSITMPSHLASDIPIDSKDLFFTSDNLEKIILMCPDIESTNFSNEIIEGIERVKKEECPQMECYRVVSTQDIDVKQTCIYTNINQETVIDLKEIFEVGKMKHVIYTGISGTEVYTGDDILVSDDYYQLNNTITYDIVGHPTSSRTKIMNNYLYIGENESALDLKVTAVLSSTMEEVPIRIKEIESISIKESPENTYQEGEYYNPNGLVISVLYNDGTTEDISYNENTKNDFTLTYDQLDVSTTQQTIKYKGFGIEQNLTIQSKYREMILNDSDNQITIQGIFSKGSYLIVEKIDSVDQELILGLENKTIIGQYEARVVGEYKGQLLLTFDIGNEYNGKKIYIRHLKQDGSIEMIDDKVRDGKVNITVSELSPFIIYIDKDKTNIGDENDILSPINNNNESSIINPIKPPLSNTNNEFITNQKSFVNNGVLTGNHTDILLWSSLSILNIKIMMVVMKKKSEHEKGTK